MPRRKRSLETDTDTDDVTTRSKRPKQHLPEPTPTTPKPPPQEKRLRPFRPSPSKPSRDRIQRAQTQRMYLVDRETISDIHQKFVILGSTGNLYTVNIKHLPTCDCPDFKKGNLCKHVLFVMLKVLRIPSTSELVYQAALISDELRSMFLQAPNPTALANATVVQQYQAIKNGQDPNAVANAVNASGAKDVRRAIEGDCPICFDELREADRGNIEFCRTCGNNVHLECFNNWKRSKNFAKITCVYCRSVWHTEGKDGDADGVAKASEGYVNLGAAANMPSARDESTYSEWYRSRNSRRGGRRSRRGRRDYDDDDNYARFMNPDFEDSDEEEEEY